MVHSLHQLEKKYLRKYKSKPQDPVCSLQNRPLSPSQTSLIQIPLPKSKCSQAQLTGRSLQITLSSSSNMLTLSLATWKIRRRDARETVILLTRNIGRVGLGQRACWNIQNARISGSLVYFVDGVNGYRQLDTWLMD